MAIENAPAKNWELSLYELHRTPQEAFTDNTEIAVSPRSLNAELMCPICLDMLRNTMTTKECLHRFCQDCIITALRSGNKECPTCRKKLVSKRSLRPDPNFDALISKIYPSREEYEAHQEKVLAKWSKTGSLAAQHMLGTPEERAAAGVTQRTPASNLKLHAALCESMMAEDPEMENEEGPESGLELGGDSGPSGSDKATHAAPNASRRIRPQPSLNKKQSLLEVELMLRPHPQMRGSNNHNTTSCEETKYLKTLVAATVEHLTAYLAMRESIERTGEIISSQSSDVSPSSFRIFISPSQSTAAPAQMQQQANIIELDLKLTLAEVHQRYWSGPRNLELLYMRVLSDKESETLSLSVAPKNKADENDAHMNEIDEKKH